MAAALLDGDQMVMGLSILSEVSLLNIYENQNIDINLNVHTNVVHIPYYILKQVHTKVVHISYYILKQ